MKSNFNDCLDKVLKDEGGYTNDPSDSGGATNFGITIQDYRLYIDPKGTPLDVKHMKLDDAKRIYKTKYWDKVDGDNLSGGVDYSLFDYAVNSGVGRAKAVASEFKSLSGTKLIDAINNERMAFLRNLAARRPKDQKFLTGWTNRVSRVRKYSYVLAGKNNSVGPAVGTTTAAAGAGISQYFHQHQTLIIISSLALAVAIGFAVHYFKNRNK